jgi:hypothetical protein
MIPQGQVALLYSGGLDSNVAALMLLPRFERVHLLTWDTGRGLAFLSWARRSAAALQARHPGRIEPFFGEVSHLMDAVTTRRLPALALRYRQRFVWCLGCKVTMHLCCLAWCLARGLRDAADGSAPDTPWYVEQMPVALDWLHAWYADHGVCFHTPVHAAGDRAEKRALLEREGIRRGPTLFGRNPGTQPLCLVGNVLYAPSTFLRLHPAFDPDRVRAFLDEGRPWFEELLARRVARERADLSSPARRRRPDPARA